MGYGTRAVGRRLGFARPADTGHRFHYIHKVFCASLTIDYPSTDEDMRLSFHNRKSLSTLPLVMALLAILAVAAVGTIELSHQHQGGDLAENCLLCKTDHGASAPVKPAIFSASIQQITLITQAIRPVLGGFLRYEQARAPPKHS